ncbi:MAG: transcriptional regulator, AraC family [Chitinophagaceae bacterium]|nr:transcriptional regulator, AraC family [Chitinophagaceae bacterium]
MSLFFDRLHRYTQSNIVLWIGVPLLLVGLFFMIIYRPAYTVVGVDVSKPIVVSSTSDAEVGGATTIQLLKNAPDKIVFSYTLREGYLTPYANIRFTPADSGFFDLSAYDRVKVKIKSTQGIRIPFYLATDVAHFTQAGKDISYRYLLSNLNISDALTIVKVPFHQLYTPDWWYISNDKTESDFKAVDLSKVKYIYFASCINLKKGLEDQVTIEEVSFHVNYFPSLIYNGLGLLLYYVGFFILYKRKIKVPQTNISFNYEKVESRNHQDKEEEAVLTYLYKEYVQQELTVIDVQNATGIHERKISTLIKKKTGLNFKQFLNDLRIAEAKKLLTATHLPVSEIAFKVGYSNASHFNRVFKASEDCSPNDYRKGQV